MKKTNIVAQSKWKNVVQITPSILAGIILIILLVNDLNLNLNQNQNQTKELLPITISHVYVEYFLSLVSSLIVLYWMLSPFYYGLVQRDSSNINPSGYGIYGIYTLVVIILSPFGLLSIRFFLHDETYVKYILLTTIISTLFILYFTLRAASI
jgi:hypothetical protein